MSDTDPLDYVKLSDALVATWGDANARTTVVNAFEGLAPRDAILVAVRFLGRIDPRSQSQFLTDLARAAYEHRTGARTHAPWASDPRPRSDGPTWPTPEPAQAPAPEPQPAKKGKAKETPS